jgi:hypothetical protein
MVTQYNPRCLTAEAPRASRGGAENPMQDVTHPASPSKRVGVVAGANRARMAEGDFYLLARQLTP